MITRNPSTRRSGSIAQVQPPQASLRSGALFFAALTATSISALVGCGQDDGPSVETDNEFLNPSERRTGSPDDPAQQQDDPPDPPSGSEGGNEDEPEFNGGVQPNGLELPEGYQYWSVIGVVDPESGDPATDTIRVIVGNRTAVAAARAGETNPWPDGSMLMHYQWANADNAFIAGAKSNGDFLRLTLMVKDSEAYVLDGGWAYGVWGGPTLAPQTASDFDRVCVNCHTTEVADNDYVFTRPGALPSSRALAAAQATPGGLAMPADILDWGVIGVVNRAAAMDETIRVVIGNRTAVTAARAGLDGAWPEGSMLGHYVWAADDNPDIADAVVPGEFQAITLMEKQGEDYGVDGGWKYGNWSSSQLAAPTTPTFDRDCVDCHTDSVSDQDFVFTIPGALPLPGL